MRSTRWLPLFLLAAAPAWAQIESREGIALQNQILELRNEIQQLQSQGGGGGEPAPAPEASPAPSGGQSDIEANLVVRVTALEEQVRTLQGRVDELTNQLQKQHDDLSKQISDLAFKLGQGGGAAAAPAEGGGDAGVQTVPAEAPAPAPVPPPPPVRRTPELALKEGNAALARRDYAGAAAMANEVIAGGHGPRVGDAEFLLARAQYGQHQYQAAATNFYKVYSHNPRSNRGAESLLGVSNALLQLGDAKDACEAVAKLGAEFPHAEGGVKAGAVSVRKRAHCR